MRGGLRIGQRFSLILNPVSWQKKGLAARHYIDVSDRPTVMAGNVDLANVAIHSRGEPFHLVDGIPYVASEVRQALSGADHGGMSEDEKRRESYAAAEANVRRMEKILSERGGGRARARKAPAA